jgi:hypothetical protein
MPPDGRIPLRVAAGAAPRCAPGEALVVARAAATPDHDGLVRHAGSAAIAQAGACPCCRRPSDLVTALRLLVIDRARGAVEFSGVVVWVDPPDRARSLAELAADPLVAARYAVPAA